LNITNEFYRIKEIKQTNKKPCHVILVKIFRLDTISYILKELESMNLDEIDIILRNSNLKKEKKKRNNQLKNIELLKWT